MQSVCGAKLEIARLPTGWQRLYYIQFRGIMRIPIANWYVRSAANASWADASFARLIAAALQHAERPSPPIDDLVRSPDPFYPVGFFCFSFCIPKHIFCVCRLLGDWQFCMILNKGIVWAEFWVHKRVWLFSFLFRNPCSGVLSGLFLCSE